MMPIKRGSVGPEVTAWQVALNDASHTKIAVDGVFGRGTEKATILFQIAQGLTPDGAVTQQTIDVAFTVAGRFKWPFLQAANYTYTTRASLPLMRAVRLIVVHTMENPEKPDSAEGVAAWFAGKRGTPPKASAHACVDNDSLVRCVHPSDVAWAAPGANADGYHIEHAGHANQTDADWRDDYSAAMLAISARHAADIASAFGIPAVKLTVDEVRGKTARGFCGHIDVTRAFAKSTHTDPGEHFPWPGYLALVNAALLMRREP
jgi:hypothetical protein